MAERYGQSAFGSAGRRLCACGGQRRPGKGHGRIAGGERWPDQTNGHILIGVYHGSRWKKIDSRRTGSTVDLNVKNPTLWSLENPYLYRAVVLVRSAGRIVDSQTVRFGIRTVTIDKDKGLFLNGKPIKLQGVCCHQDHAGVGSALPDYLQYYRIQLLKEMGVNAYRTSHNPPTPELLDACDSLGMLVLDETRLLNSGAEYGADFEQLILRDRNHPSVFMWSIGNEEWVIQTSTTGKLIAQHQVQRQQRLDPLSYLHLCRQCGECLSWRQ